MKKLSKLIIKNLLTLVIISSIGVCLIIYPTATAHGIKNGLRLLGNNLIPSLFPFMVLSSYVSQSSLSRYIKRLFEKPFMKIFKINGYGIIPFILGLLGGYPVGAKVLEEFYREKKLTENETERLFYWCVNPSPAFTITAIGTFMLGNTQSGVILYVSCILSALTVGFLCSFLSDKTEITKNSERNTTHRNIFVKSVSSGSEGMLSVCGWVLTFSVLSALCDALKLPPALCDLVKSVAEVTTGCKNASQMGLSLPVIAGILGFGGLAVICQCLVYSSTCKVKTKFFICSRLINSALSAVYCSFILKLFPQSQQVVAVVGSGNASFTLYHSMGATIILFIMCALLILEVDNRKKVC